ncbi:hypothetical protein O5O45_08825 [Hahella aquimaris]|uniref:tetratricopeptide repeat protein n=1 Tax=Hahella sp. HNIBRBA332 TaxID=3015983 RepID=UPI00273C86C6|nr:hypothetical protein [Hahella sp. HNIBRBA332]WLQ16016.1 hypothetical protein O5O45_08825 [Hahella sp. HNIBRBA332]
MIRKLIIIIFSLFCSHANSAGCIKCNKDKYEEAFSLYQDNELDLAETLYEGFLSTDPIDNVSLVMLANIKLLKKEYESAEVFADKALYFAETEDIQAESFLVKAKILLQRDKNRLLARRLAEVSHTLGQSNSSDEAYKNWKRLSEELASFNASFDTSEYESRLEGAGYDTPLIQRSSRLDYAYKNADGFIRGALESNKSSLHNGCRKEFSDSYLNGSIKILSPEFISTDYSDKRLLPYRKLFLEKTGNEMRSYHVETLAGKVYGAYTGDIALFKIRENINLVLLERGNVIPGQYYGFNPVSTLYLINKEIYEILSSPYQSGSYNSSEVASKIYVATQDNKPLIIQITESHNAAYIDLNLYKIEFEENRKFGNPWASKKICSMNFGL